MEKKIRLKTPLTISMFIHNMLQLVRMYCSQHPEACGVSSRSLSCLHVHKTDTKVKMASIFETKIYTDLCLIKKTIENFLHQKEALQKPIFFKLLSTY